MKLKMFDVLIFCFNIFLNIYLSFKFFCKWIYKGVFIFLVNYGDKKGV